VRTRLLGIVGLLGALMVICLGLPLAISVADSEQQKVFVDRLAGATKVASDAQRAIIEDNPVLLAPALTRFQQVYGQRTAVFDPNRKLLVGSPSKVDPRDPTVAPALDAALAGRLPDAGALLLPWSAEPMVMTQPVLVDGELRAVVVTVSSTHNARMRVLWYWTLIAIGAVLVFTVGLLIALPLARWFLRPVHLMDEATEEVATAVIAGEPVPRFAPGSGPPELRRLSTSVFTMADRVAAALVAQRAFVADASHQLRNPLTALKLRLSNLRDELPDEVLPQADAAADEVDRLTRILDELLAMARAESDGAPAEEVDVAAFADARLHAWRSAAEVKDVRLGRGGNAAATVRIQPAGLEAVLDALLDNAIKFTERATTVRVDVDGTADTVGMTVSDEGPGLRVEELDRATDRFWRSARDQNVPGSGLGLAIVHRIVDRAGGSVVVRNGERGLLVEVSLPRVPDRSA
jgi:signal transduction histidine kinase